VLSLISSEVDPPRSLFSDTNIAPILNHLFYYCKIEKERGVVEKTAVTSNVYNLIKSELALANYIRVFNVE
jgi:hypothetical protein